MRPTSIQALEVPSCACRPRFIGLVPGSRRHTGHHLEALRTKGVADDVIARIQSPVGLDIGAKTAGEIAISILGRRSGCPQRWRRRLESHPLGTTLASVWFVS